MPAAAAAAAAAGKVVSCVEGVDGGRFLMGEATLFSVERSRTVIVRILNLN